MNHRTAARARMLSMSRHPHFRATVAQTPPSTTARETWTKATLIDAARERGIRGFSRMTKDELLIALG